MERDENKSIGPMGEFGNLVTIFPLIVGQGEGVFLAKGRMLLCIENSF